MRGVNKNTTIKNNETNYFDTFYPRKWGNANAVISCRTFEEAYEVEMMLKTHRLKLKTGSEYGEDVRFHWELLGNDICYYYYFTEGMISNPPSTRSMSFTNRPIILKWSDWKNV